jgi:hypothetical protein
MLRNGMQKNIFQKRHFYKGISTLKDAFDVIKKEGA